MSIYNMWKVEMGNVEGNPRLLRYDSEDQADFSGLQSARVLISPLCILSARTPCFLVASSIFCLEEDLSNSVKKRHKRLS